MGGQIRLEREKPSVGIQSLKHIEEENIQEKRGEE